MTRAAAWWAFDAVPPSHVEAIDLPRAAGGDRLRAASAARSLLATTGRAADVVIGHDPELVSAAIAVCPDRTAWDVHEDTAG